MEQSIDRFSAIESLTEFPYLGNYLRLSFIEWDLLELNGDEKILFIGSGPFPLTAVILNLISRAAQCGRLPQLRSICHAPEFDAQAFCLEINQLISLDISNGPTLQVDLLDRSTEATECARQMISVLGLSEDMKPICGDGLGVRLNDDCSIIYVASMVQGKEAVIQNLIKQATHPLKILIRGVEPGSLKELLYEPLSDTEISAIAEKFPGFSEIKTFWPDNRSGVINSVHIFGYNFMQ